MPNQQPQQPGWDQQLTQPGRGPQPPAPNKNTGKIIGLGCLGVIVLFVLIGIIAAIATSGADKKRNSPPAKEPAASALAETKKPDEPKRKSQRRSNP
ncbi:hypothetical protein [Streptomyces sp. NPDC056010]|uniref:hypothetical protein n=1 Tax=Streptomyces sp. NPDC056010 TaxID=3345679 RepID=UPI0035D9E156